MITLIVALAVTVAVQFAAIAYIAHVRRNTHDAWKASELDRDGWRELAEESHKGRVVRDMEYDITDLVRRAHEIAVDRGWWPEEKLERVRDGDPDVIAAQLALIHSEVSEALEDLRVGNMTTTFRADGKPEGFDSELADIVIRVFDLAGARGCDLAQEIGRKMEFNKTRSHRHGGKAI